MRTRAHSIKFCPGVLPYHLEIPAGLDVAMIHDGQGKGHWVLNEFPQDLFPLGSILRHDITHRYIYLEHDNVEPGRPLRDMPKLQPGEILMFSSGVQHLPRGHAFPLEPTLDEICLSVGHGWMTLALDYRGTLMDAPTHVGKAVMRMNPNVTEVGIHTLDQDKLHAHGTWTDGQLDGHWAATRMNERNIR